MIKPPPLMQGDTIALVSPAVASLGEYPERTARVIANLNELGYRIKLGKAAYLPADLPKDRADQLRAEELNSDLWTLCVIE